MTTLLMDSNDATQDPSVLASLRSFFGADNVQVTSLQQGDISIALPTGSLLIERKRPFDLLGSIGDGRIFSQAQRMVNHARFAVVLIQGSLSYNRDDFALADGRPTNWRGKSVRSALRAIQFAGVAVDYCSQGEFAKAVDEIITIASKPDHYHLQAERLRPPPIDFFGGQSTAEMQRVAILASFPGIGQKRAQSLLRWIGDNYGYKGKFSSTRADDTTSGERPFGRVCDALEWASMLGSFDKDHRPDGWGDGNIGKLRLALDLNADEYITVERYFDQETINKVQALPIIEDTSDDATVTVTANTDSVDAALLSQTGREAHVNDTSNGQQQQQQHAAPAAIGASATAPQFGQALPATKRNTRAKQPRLI